jgi:hypothetical protein
MGALCRVMAKEQGVPQINDHSPWAKQPLTMGESTTTICFFHRQCFFENKFLIHESGESILRYILTVLMTFFQGILKTLNPKCGDKLPNKKHF